MDHQSTFVKRFGDLVTLFRLDPGNDAAQELALSAAADAVAEAPVRVEAGVEWTSMPPGMGLKERMLARQVDCLRVAAGASALELQSLARALAHDVTPVRSSPSIEVELVRLIAPPPPPSGDPGPGSGPGGGGAAPSPRRGSSRGERRRRSVERRAGGDRRHMRRARWSDLERRRHGERRQSGERRVHLVAELHADTARLLEALDQASREGRWEAALHAAWALARFAPRVPLAERRLYGIQVRRALPRRTLEALVELAEHDHLARGRAADVLQWVGSAAAEVVLDRLRRNEALGVRVFLYEVVGGMPAAYPQVVPMLRSHVPHEVRHGAALLGRMRLRQGLAELAPLVSHPDELVRAAALGALGELHDAPVADALRRALRHPSPRTRAAAADAVATWRGGALALLIAAVLEREADRETWDVMVRALGRIGSPDACAALAQVAVTGRGFLRRHGYSTGQRLAAVSALGLAETEAGHVTLERLARLSEGVVSYAADRVLHAEGLRAG